MYILLHVRVRHADSGRIVHMADFALEKHVDNFHMRFFQPLCKYLSIKILAEVNSPAWYENRYVLLF